MQNLLATEGTEFKKNEKKNLKSLIKNLIHSLVFISLCFR
jgi:hypothetical protein